MSGGELLQPYQLLQAMADFCERERIPYRVVGSMASILYGEPRFTNDVDVLVDMTEQHITAIEKEFQIPISIFQRRPFGQPLGVERSLTSCISHPD